MGERLTAAALAAVVALSSMPARAQLPELPDLVLAPCPGASGIQPAPGGGLHVPSDAARCLLGRVEAFGELVPYVRLLEERLRLSDERHALQARAAALAAQEAETASEALEAAVRRAREAEESRDAWHRSPALWLALGVVVTLLLEVVAVVVFAEVAR